MLSSFRARSKSNLREASRVLSPTGKMLFITDDPPEQRTALLEAALGEDFRVIWRALEPEEASDNTWEYYVYTCTRRP